MFYHMILLIISQWRCFCCNPNWLHGSVLLTVCTHGQWKPLSDFGGYSSRYRDSWRYFHSIILFMRCFFISIPCFHLLSQRKELVTYEHEHLLCFVCRLQTLGPPGAGWGTDHGSKGMVPRSHESGYLLIISAFPNALIFSRIFNTS